MDTWFDDWALTLAVFIPAVGMLSSSMLIPRAEEQADQGGHALITTLDHARHRRSRLLADFNYDKTSTLQFNVKEKWIDVINSQLPRRRSTASRCRCSCCRSFITVLVRDLLVEPLPRAAQREGVPRV